MRVKTIGTIQRYNKSVSSLYWQGRQYGGAEVSLTLRNPCWHSHKPSVDVLFTSSAMMTLSVHTLWRMAAWQSGSPAQVSPRTPAVVKQPYTRPWKQHNHRTPARQRHHAETRGVTISLATQTSSKPIRLAITCENTKYVETRTSLTIKLSHVNEQFYRVVW
jgi:hypothetical protein